MTPEAMAEQIIPKGTHPYREDADDLRVEIAEAIRAAVAEERERCAKVAEKMAVTHPAIGKLVRALEIAAAIRGGAP